MTHEAMTSPKKERIAVLFIVPSLRRAGAETQVVNLVNRLDPEEFDKHLLIFEKDDDQLERVHQDSVKFHHPKRTRRWLDFDLAANIARIIDQERIDVVHCSLQFSVLWGWLARLQAKRKPSVIAVLHTTINVDLKTELQDRLLYQWILRRCQAVIFVCEKQKAYWESRYPFLVGRSDVVYNGVDTAWFEPTKFQHEGSIFRNELNIPEQGVVLACIARFAPEKGQHLLVAACASLDQRSVHLVFAGDGPLRAEVEGQVKRLGLADHVRFIGNVSDVRPLLAATDLLVLPSTAVETFSMAMLEALSMATPVLGSDIGGMGEAVLENETGALVQAGDIADLTRRIGTLTADRGRLESMGARGRELVVEQFSEALMVENTASIIRRVARWDSAA
jgi:glycosyltransferase involved in cell wall biosynthesis